MTDVTDLKQQIIDIEIALDHQQKAIDDLSDMVVRQGKIIDKLSQQSDYFRSLLDQDVVKPLSEETPPPHY